MWEASKQMKTLVLYESKYGSTEKYACWLSEALSCEQRRTSQMDPAQLQAYDTLILGGGIYATGIAGVGFLKKNVQAIQDKKVLVFAVGASPFDEHALEEIRRRNLKGPLAKLPLFYCRGAWNEDLLTVKDRMMVGLLKKMVSQKNPADYAPWERALMQAIGTVCDWTDPKELQQILQAIQGRTEEVDEAVDTQTG